MQPLDARNDRSDSVLLDAARQGDYDAFEELVRRYRDRIFRLAHGMTKTTAEAQEVVQDTFLSLFRGLHSYRGQSTVASWIYRIAANSALMRLRRGRRHALVSIEDRPSAWYDDGKRWIVPPGEWSRTPDEKLLTRELGSRLDAAIGRLPEQYRVVLLLRDVEGLDITNVAETLGLTVPTVKSRLHRARLFVRAELESYFDDA